MLSPPGIKNHGNICFASSILHLIFNQEYFRGVLDSVKAHHSPSCNACQQGSTSRPCTCIIAALCALRQKYTYQATSEILSSADLLTSLTSINSILKPGEEHDAQEFLTFLFGVLMRNTPLELADAFKKNTHVEMTQRVRCNHCGYTTHKIQQELYLEIHAQGPSARTIGDMVNDCYDEQLLTDGRCSRCNKLGIHRENVPSSSPSNLIIHVTRIDSGCGYPKIQIQNAFLRLRNRICYKLVGVIKHIALGLGGHYTCYFLDHGQKQWFYANDEKVSPVDISDVLEQGPFLLLYDLCDESVPALSLQQCTRISSNQWLTDEIIQVYMEMIRMEAIKAGVKTFILGSQFMEKLETTGYSGVTRWHKSVNMLQQDLLLAFINHGRCHWTLLVVDIKKKQAEYYDSYHHDSPGHWQRIQKYLTKRYENCGSPHLHWENWTYKPMKDIPKQSNGEDCGVFVCQFALYRIRGEVLNFTQEHMTTIRGLLKEELLSGNLVDHATRTRQILGKHHSLLPATPTAQPHGKNLKLNKRKERSDVISGDMGHKGEPVLNVLKPLSGNQLLKAKQNQQLPRNHTSLSINHPNQASHIPSKMACQSRMCMPPSVEQPPPSCPEGTKQPPGLSPKQPPNPLHSTMPIPPNGRSTLPIVSKHSPGSNPKQPLSALPSTRPIPPNGRPTPLDSTQPHNKTLPHSLPNTVLPVSSQSGPHRNTSTTSKNCHYCGKVYAFKTGLSKHLRKEHSHESQNEPQSYLVCNQCQSSYLTIKDLIHHLKSTHGYPVQVDILHFADFTTYLAWKDEEETRTHSNYVQQCAPQTYNTKQHWYYYCNRSGIYRSTTKRVRHTKGQGSCKIGERCIAHMKATKDITTGEVVVKYCSTHHNHEANIGHLRMQHDTRMKIAAHLQQGVTMERIMDNIRGNTVRGITREHLVTKQDIHNIKHHYNIEGVMRHENDLTSICAWVEELNSLPYNPVLLFKPQGEPQPHDMDNVGTDDFILGIQTQFQRDMLCKYGDTCVCMDATHGTNMYDFNLITVLVIDEFGEGIPVAWAISNREDVTLLVQFFKAIEKRTGSLTPLWFMSDDAQQYFNAWSGVFNTNGTKKLLCAWHVDRAWRAALNDHVTNMQTRVEIYHQLRILLMENEERIFRVLLQQFISSLCGSEQRFCKYFKEHYCNRLGQWASYFRAGTIVNTNMFLEAFHRTLKVVYLQQKNNRRIDFLLHILLKIAKDKVFERLTKLEKGKYSHRISEINKRHKSGIKMLPHSTNISEKDNKCWIVPSENDGSVRYTVRLIKETCDCKLRCSSCMVCVHLYSCTCMDSTLHSTVCKHVHLVKIMSDPVSEKVTNPQRSLEYFSCLLEDKVEDSQLTTLRQQVLGKLNDMTILVTDCRDIDALKTTSKHVTSAIMAIRAMQSTLKSQSVTLPLKRKIPPNQNAEKQPRFFSTKKKHVGATQRLSKPSYLQVKEERSNLLNQTTTCCGICFKENDNSSNDFVNWVQCSSCEIWLHVICATGRSDEYIEDYICESCSTY